MIQITHKNQFLELKIPKNYPTPVKFINETLLYLTYNEINDSAIAETPIGINSQGKHLIQNSYGALTQEASYSRNKPDENIPDREKFGVTPWQYIVFQEPNSLSLANKNLQKKYFINLLNLKKQWSSYIHSIFLIGESWLDFDDDGIPKCDGQIKFLNSESQTFKVFETKIDFENYFSTIQIKPQSWVWKIY